MLRIANIARPKGIGGLVLLIASCAVQGACAQIPLHANLSDAQLHERLGQYFPAGMTVSEAHAELDALKVPRGQRAWYEAGAGSPPQMLVRVFEPGGIWLNDEDQTIRWTDVVLVFRDEKPEARLDRTETFRGRQRYWCGDPVNVPATPTRYAWREYPAMPPPPLEPPVKEGAADGR